MTIEPENASSNLLLDQNVEIATHREVLEIACARQPDDPVLWDRLGQILQHMGEIAQAGAAFRKAVTLAPDCANYHDNLGIFLRLQNDYKAAELAHRAALARQSDHPAAHYNLGLSLKGQKKSIEARMAFRIGLKYRQDDPLLLAGLGSILIMEQRYGEAIPWLRRALDLIPENTETIADLATAMMIYGHTRIAKKLIWRGLNLDTNNSQYMSVLIFCLWFDPETDESETKDVMAEFDRRYCRPLMPAILPSIRNPDPDRPLRIGYLCGDFRTHSNSCGFGRMILERERRQQVIFLYSTLSTDDEVTEQFRESADVWHDMPDVTEAAFAEQIQRDEIDILVDLASHTSGGRMGVFARKPAPIQVTWINRSGLSAVDWLLTDAVIDPLIVDSDKETGPERPARLSVGALPYLPPDTAMQPVQPGPLARNEAPVFGCFNNILKLNDRLFAVWGRLLEMVPTAQLLLKHGFDQDVILLGDLRKRLQRHGIDSDRVGVAHGTNHQIHMKAYSEIDVALDSFPGNGGITTWEALWMGVPVVTCKGQRFNGRATASILSALGLEEWIAADMDEYCQIAAALVRDPKGLAARRVGLRAQIQASPIMTPGVYAEQVNQAYRHMWRLRCAGLG